MSQVFFSELPVEIEKLVLKHVPPNDVACNFRLLNKAAASRLRATKHTTIRLSKPVPEGAFQQHFSTSALREMTLQQRRHALRVAARLGNLGDLAHILEHAGCVPTGAMVETAAVAGHLAACQWLLQRGCPLGKALEAACPGGHLEVCLWAREQGCPWDGALKAAAGKGHRHVCEWALSEGCELGDDAVVAAGRGGHVDLLDWMLQRNGARTISGFLILESVAFGCGLATLQRMFTTFKEEMDTIGVSTKSAIVLAALTSPMPVWREKADWLAARGFPPPSQESHTPVVSGLPDAAGRLRWLAGHGYRDDDWLVRSAAWVGCTSSLGYLLGELRVQETVNMVAACMLAAEKGHLPALKLMHSHGVVDPGSVALNSANSGQLGVLAWVLETCPGEVTRALSWWGAASSGNAQVLKWLEQRGFRHTQRQAAGGFEEAVKAGSEAALEWLVAQFFDVPATGAPYVIAAHNGDLATLRCLRRLGCAWGPSGTFTKCVSSEDSSAPLPALRWLVKAGCPVDWEAALQAAQQRPRQEALDDREEVAQWLGSVRPANEG